MNLFTAIGSGLRLPELRNKILFTAGCIVVDRLFASVVVPGADLKALDNLFKNNQLLSLLDLFSGGGLSNFSLVAMGVNPYINATIIMQLMTVVSERLNDVYKNQGEAGRRKFNRWSRYLCVVLALLQSYGYTVLFQNSNPAILPRELDWFQRVTIMATLTSGTILLMWLGELITEYGIGNGVSLIIFAGIVARGATQAINAGQSHATASFANALPIIGFVAIALLSTAFIIFVQQAVRKIPIQSAQRVQGGSRTVQPRANSLPIRVNTAGVIPIIFAISVMYFPQILSNYALQGAHDSWYYKAGTWVQGNFQPTAANVYAAIAYNVLYFLFVFGFTYFYTAIMFNVDDVADNLKRSSTFIPGIRPGRPTAEYLAAVLNRVTFAGAIFLGMITVVLPLATAKLTGIPPTQLYLGGTAILIVVGVALDTMKQLETQLIMREYRGFIR